MSERLPTPPASVPPRLIRLMPFAPPLAVMLWKARLPLELSSAKAVAPVLIRATLFGTVTPVTPEPVMALIPIVVMSSELTVVLFASTTVPFTAGWVTARIVRLPSAKVLPWPHSVWLGLSVIRRA